MFPGAWVVLASIVAGTTGVPTPGEAVVTAEQRSSREIYLEAREDLLDERYPEAIEGFRRIVAEHPSSAEADDAQYYVGYALAELGRDEEAVAAYDELIRRWPDSVRVERAQSRRARLLASRSGDGASSALLREVIDGSGSWTLRRDTAFALARKGDLSAADVLEQAMERESTSRQIELARILTPMASEPTARRILLRGLDSGRSSSVKLRTLEALSSVVSQPEVARSIGQLFVDRTSSSVGAHAVQVLSPHLDVPAVRQALAASLGTELSSSVQVAACAALRGHLTSPEVLPSAVEVFRAERSSSVRLRCLDSLGAEKDLDPAASILREALSSSQSSSSVRRRAVQVAAGSSSDVVRATLTQALTSGTSTSVQLAALGAIRSTSNDEATAAALADLFRDRDASTSVLIAGVEALSRHIETDSGRVALVHALSNRHSTSVLLKALPLGGVHTTDPAVRSAVQALLEDESTSTSVQLEAIKVLRPRIGSPEIRAVVGSALQSGTSTSVMLKAVQALGAAREHEDARALIVKALDDDFSTSVVLEAIDELDRYVERDPAVRAGFQRAMESTDMSLTARVRSARALQLIDDSSLDARIAEAMEDVVMRARRYGRSNHRDLIEDALEVLEDVDPRRAEELRGRDR